MNIGGKDGRDSARNPTFGCIASSGRRVILGVLLDRGTPVTEQALATHLAATDQPGPRAGPTAREVRAARSELAHVHLPALEDAGLVTWNRMDSTVAATPHPALEDPRFRRLLAAEADGFDEVLSALSHDHRRIVLTTLRNEQSPRSRTELVQVIRRHESEATEPRSAAVKNVAVSLYHVHLPKLANAELVEYDPDTGRVAYAPHPILEQVLGIIFEPDERVFDKFDGFLGGLETSYRQASRDAGEQLDWPHFWRDTSHG